MRIKMSDKDPDYPAMSAGQLHVRRASRRALVDRIRDKEGLSYGVSSRFRSPAKDDGAMFVA